MFNSIIASISRMSPIKSQHQSFLPLALNGFDLSNGDFTSSDFSEAHLSEADLTHTIFEKADLIDGNLCGCILNHTIFNNANLAGAELTGIKQGCAIDFTDASLQGTDFSESEFIDTSFDNADMHESILEHSVFGVKCHFEGANFSLSTLNNSDISKASIEGALFSDEDNDEDDELFAITKLTLTQEQLEYISSFPNVEIYDYIIV